MHIKISTKDGIPIYRQVIQQIEHQIAAKRLKPGDQLPPVRKLAEQLLINPNTVARVYRELETAGILATRQGSGVFVREDLAPPNKAQRTRLLAELADRLLEQARELDVPHEELLALLEKRSRRQT
ncbi:GntR family transcriptional regulator [Planctomycetota bacterium]